MEVLSRIALMHGASALRDLAAQPLMLALLIPLAVVWLVMRD